MNSAVGFLVILAGVVAIALVLSLASQSRYWRPRR